MKTSPLLKILNGRNMLRKTTFREIRRSLGRYIAILAIVALGVGFFSGLKVTREAMVSTANDYLTAQHMFDYRLISTLGLDDQSVSDAAALPGVRAAEGTISKDVIIESGGDSTSVFTALSVPDKINKVKLTKGRMPRANDECVVDAAAYSKKGLGDTITISSSNDSDTTDYFKYKSYKIVGLVSSPIYLNFERGNTNLGTGSLSGFFYIPADGFDAEYYSEVYIKLDSDYPIYSDQYNDAVDDLRGDVKALGKDTTARRYDEIVSKAEDKLAKQQKKYDDSYADYLSEKRSAYDQLDAAAAKISSGEAQISSSKAKLDKTEATLKANKTKIENGISQLADQRAQFESQKQYMTEEQIAQTEATLAASEQKLKTSLTKVNAGLASVESGRQTLAEKQSELAASKTKLADSRAEADDKFAEAKAKLDDAKDKLDSAQEKINKIKRGNYYVLDRSMNTGYASFESDSNIVNGIAAVFPLFFFLVAALVCMTTMTRMVEEHRTQIGVLKALGYSNRSVIGQYLFYSGSAAAIGALSGFFAGSWLFPAVIWNAYGMMYDFSGSIDYIINVPLGVLSIATAMICALGATWVSCAEDFKVAPAQLIRPKTPKEGKRILLERIGFIWSRLSFLHKVSMRNIFRYKKHFFMMVIGISGCTALLIAGFGINDSIKNLANFQYDEIQTYDYSVTFDQDMTKADQKDFLDYTGDNASDVLFVHQSTGDFTTGGKTKSVTLIASDGKNFDDFVSLHNNSGSISYPGNGEAVVCRKLMAHYDVNVGDKITITDEDGNKMTVKVSGVCDNYVYNYIYINNETYEKGFGQKPEYKTAFVKNAGSSSTAIHQSAAKCSDYSAVSGTFVTLDMRSSVNKMMKSLNAVIIVVVLCAGALAFIVMYNLTNITITERIREIATIKVLGFYPLETSQYVFRENFFMAAIGALVGIPLGRLLLDFVISQIQVDMVFFEDRITLTSYIFSIALTFVFAIIVSLGMHPKLMKISMTESLKSIE